MHGKLVPTLRTYRDRISAEQEDRRRGRIDVGQRSSFAVIPPRYDRCAVP